MNNAKLIALAYQKAASFCGYQERCTSEVKEKLRNIGLSADDMRSVIAKLEDEGYLNEERFAKAFCSGKFRFKKWGRIKIRYEMFQKGISEDIIEKGLASIDDDDYRATLRDLADKKREQMESPADRRVLFQYLSSKGYESSEINAVVFK